MLPSRPRLPGRAVDGSPAAHAAQRVERDEVRLVDRIAVGDMRAFDALYRLYHGRLSRFLGRLVQRTGLVEEALNDTMLVVWHRADSFNGQSKVSTWIFGIAYRKALKALQRFDEPLEDELPQTRVDDGPGPEQQVGHGQLREALAKALDGLSPEHRAVVELTYFHGMSCREISEIVHCPVDTVKTRMFHARRRLRTLLAGGSEDWL
jgi:RNA polymerase sigma-70 factor (ECF subfamily)